MVPASNPYSCYTQELVGNETTLWRLKTNEGKLCPACFNEALVAARVSQERQLRFRKGNGKCQKRFLGLPVLKMSNSESAPRNMVLFSEVPARHTSVVY